MEFGLFGYHLCVYFRAPISSWRNHHKQSANISSVSKNPRKIEQIANTYVIVHLAHWDQLLGGAELQLKYVSEYLKKKGAKVHVVFPDRTGVPVDRSIAEPHPIRHMKIPKTFGRTWFRYKMNITQRLDEIQPEVVITRTFSSWAGIVSDYAVEHGLQHLHFVASDGDVGLTKAASLKKFLDNREFQLGNRVYSGFSKVFVQNAFQQEQLLTRFGLKTTVITQCAPQNDPSLILKDEGPIKVLWIGNMKWVKRPERFIQLAQHFKAEERVEFEMVGGYSSDNYRKMLSEAESLPNFHYSGHMPNEDVNQLLNTAHVLVNTSDVEGFSNTFIQAWLRKVVVISLNSDPDSILTKQGIGVKAETMTNLINTITAMLDNPQELKEKGEKARLYASNYHTVTHVYPSIFER